MRFLIAIMAFGFWSTQVFASDDAEVVVTGSGEIAVVPDLAIISLGVRHEADTAQEAMSQVSADMSSIMTTLSGEGIADQDIQTARIQIQTIHHDGRRVQFNASNQVTVRVRDLSGLGRILGQMIADGANEVGGWSSGVRFDVSDRAPFQAEARKAAVQDAMAKAKELAEAAGVTLGAIKKISESGGGSPRGIEIRRRANFAGDVPVAEGEVIIREDVQMVFALNQ